MEKNYNYFGRHAGSGKSAIEKITVLENFFDNIPDENIKDGKLFILGQSGTGKTFRTSGSLNIKPVSNNWRKMHHKPMLRKRNGITREKYWIDQLHFLIRK